MPGTLESRRTRGSFSLETFLDPGVHFFGLTTRYGGDLSKPIKG